MNVQFTPRAKRDYADLLPRLKRAVDKQLDFLTEKPENLRHPSIQAKKYSETDDVWQGRVNRNYRFYFSDRRRYLCHPADHSASEMKGLSRFTRSAECAGSRRAGTPFSPKLLAPPVPAADRRPTTDDAGP